MIILVQMAVISRGVVSFDR